MRFARTFLMAGLLPVAVLLSGMRLQKKFGRRPAVDTKMPIFRDISAQAGIRFLHVNGPTREKYMPETMGSGVVFFDYNNDGFPDIFLVNGGSLVDPNVAQAARSRLYRNNGDGTFTDVTEKSGIRNRGYGMGACAADYDNDGWVDLYITNFGHNVLYHNNGDGTFSDVTQKAGVGKPNDGPLWSTSCAFGDFDKDGHVDLFVANYVDFNPSNNKFCGDHTKDVRAYCHPNVYNGVADILYHNNGDGTFTDITRASGLYTTDGKGLGVVVTDYNNDGWPDILVANDSVPNFLFENKGNGTFKEVGFLSGMAVNGNGRPGAGMGIDAADYDGSGQIGVYITHLDLESNTLYQNTGGLFLDVSSQSGTGEPSLPFVGFGTSFFDYDNDGLLDLTVANGNVLDNASYFRDTATYEQRNLLFHNEGNGTFKEVGLSSGPGFGLLKVSRGLAVADIDNDGFLDLVITNNGQTTDLLHNEGGNGNHALLFRMVGTRSNRDGIGARLTLIVGGRTQIQEVKAGSSYLSQSDMRVHFGMGSAREADRLQIRWPSGMVETLEKIPADQVVTIREGQGIVARTPLRQRRVAETSAAPLRAQNSMKVH